MHATDTVILPDGYGAARSLGEDLVEELGRRLASNKLELPSLPEVALAIRKALLDDGVSNAEKPG